jgi:uncharacterized protein
MNKETLKGVIQQFMERPLPSFKRRAIDVPLDSGKVVNILGARRTGKTYLMFQLIRDLREMGVDPERILYINFEDDRLYPVEAAELDLILKAHRELYPSLVEQRIYIFFDEIQNVQGWERYVRRIVDTENAAVFISGSSSALLRRDLSTAMRGRSISFEVYPLAFSEFIEFRGLENVPYSERSRTRLVNAFREYLDWGGFPEVVLADAAVKPLILQEYASLMLHRDLVERYSIRNERLMHLLLKFCAEHTASLVSINKLYNDFTSQGLKLSKDTLYDYMGMLEDSFIAFSAAKYDPSSRRQLQAPRKVHFLDPGLIRAYRPYPERDIGRRFESLIYLHERRRRAEINYYRNSFELDMCWDDGGGFVNVAWDMSDRDACDREIRALDAGRSMWPQAEARLIYGIADKLAEPIRPFAIEGWKYLLDS